MGVAWRGGCRTLVGRPRCCCPGDASSRRSLTLSPTRANEAPIANRVMTCLVQQSYNTTSTNGIPPTHTTEVVAALETPRDQDEHQRAPISSHGRWCSHNPKVAGSNPAPATNSTRSEALSASAGRASSVAGCQRLVNTPWRRRPWASVRSRWRSCDWIGAGDPPLGWNGRPRESTRARGRRLLPRPLGPQPEGLACSEVSARPCTGARDGLEVPSE